MMSYSDDLNKLDKIAKRLSGRGKVRSMTVKTPNGYLIEITDEKFREITKSGQNPITLIVNTTANAAAKSSLSFSQEIQSIIHDLEKSNLDPNRLSDARRKLNTLESELNKPNPNETVIKKVVNWASQFSLELFLRIAVIVAERFIKPM